MPHQDAQFPLLFRISTDHPFTPGVLRPVQLTYGGYGTYYTLPPYSVVEGTGPAAVPGGTTTMLALPSTTGSIDERRV